MWTMIIVLKSRKRMEKKNFENMNMETWTWIQTHTKLKCSAFCICDSLFFFFFDPWFLTFLQYIVHTSKISDKQYILVSPVHCLRDSHTLFFNNFFIKNRSHDTIYIFKNYFITIFLIFNKINHIQTDLITDYADLIHMDGPH